MASLNIPENIRLRKIPERRTKSLEEISEMKTYYERNREKCLAKSRERYRKENPNKEYSSFATMNENMESGQWFYDGIPGLKSNTCYLIISELGKTGRGRTHRYISCGLIGRGYGTRKNLPILKKELNAMENNGLLEKKGSGRGTLYCLTERGLETAVKLERMFGLYDSSPISIL